MSKFENIIYKKADRLAILEKRAAELERLLLLVTDPEGDAQLNVAVPEAGRRHAGAFKGGGVCPSRVSRGLGSAVRCAHTVGELCVAGGQAV